jgi:hypothetical protein
VHAESDGIVLGIMVCIVQVVVQPVPVQSLCAKDMRLQGQAWYLAWNYVHVHGNALSSSYT